MNFALDANGVTPVLKKYTAARSKVAEPATVNKELAHLRRAFHLGLEHEPPLVTKVPRFRMMPVDLRRTAVTNMIEAGFTEKEAMEISGHKTRAVFDRYHIISERLMRQLSARMAAHMRAKELEEVVPVKIQTSINS